MLKPESIKRGISSSVLLGLLTKGLAFLIQLSIVAYFGAKGSTDVFFLCLGLVLSLWTVAINLDAAIVIPHAIHLQNTRGKPEMNGFLRKILRTYLLITLAIAFVLVVFAGEAMGLLSKFDGGLIAENITLIRLCFLFLPINVAATLLADVFAIHKLFSVSIVIDILRGIVNLAVFMGLRNWLGGDAMAVGLLAGGVVQLILLVVVMKSRLGWFPGAVAQCLTPKLRVDMGFILLGHAAFLLSFAYTSYLMSGFRTGVFSAMNCAQSLVNPIQLVFLTKTSYVAGIYFMDLYAQKRMAELNALFLNYLKPILLALLVTLPFVMFFSLEIVALVFQRGNFTRDDAALTSGFFRFFVASLPLLLLDAFATQIVFAAKKARSGVYLQILSSAASILVVGVLIGRIGHLGYPLGILLVRFLYLFALWAYLRMSVPFLDYGAALVYLGKNTLSISLAMACLWPLRESGRPLLGMLMALAGFIGVWVWGENRTLASRLLGMARKKMALG